MFFVQRKNYSPLKMRKTRLGRKVRKNLTSTMAAETKDPPPSKKTKSSGGGRMTKKQALAENKDSPPGNQPDSHGGLQMSLKEATEEFLKTTCTQTHAAKPLAAKTPLPHVSQTKATENLA